MHTQTSNQDKPKKTSLRTEEQIKKKREAARKWYAKNKDTANHKLKVWRKNNTDKRKEYARKYHQDNKDKIKDGQLKRKYGISLVQWNNLFESQNLGCAVCFTKEITARGWHTDHSHTTKKVRGILCHNCNIILGLAKDNPGILQSAERYLNACNVLV